MDEWTNKSPESTAVAAVVAIHVASRWAGERNCLNDRPHPGHLLQGEG
jgi:hypothetical protein